jgi:hypothetical protein
MAAWIFVAILFRGVLSIRALREFRDDMRRTRQENAAQPGEGMRSP